MRNYLIEFSLTHMALMLGYWLILKNEQKYGLIRFFLIGSIIMALILPLLKLPKILGKTNLIDLDPVQAISVKSTALSPPVASSETDYSLLVWMFAAISLFFFVKSLYSITYLIHLRRRNSIWKKIGRVYVFRIPALQGSFSFFNWIFLDDKIENDACEAVLAHEQGHYFLGHTYDLVFMDLIKVCFWWLPSIWYVRSQIREIHEYQADAYAIKFIDMGQYSSILISCTLKISGLDLASSFHDGLLGKRLEALRQQQKNLNPLKHVAISGLCIVLLIVFACSEEDAGDQTISGSKITANAEINSILTPENELPLATADAFYKYLENAIRYPREALKMKVEGRVDVAFAVEKDGTLSNVRVIKGIRADCDKEAVRVVQNAPKFLPATQNGRPVRVRMIMPIVFTIKTEKSGRTQAIKGMVAFEKVQTNHAKFNVNARYADDHWSGIVLDEDGEGLPGVNILVADTKTRVVSDLNGSFKVAAHKFGDLYLSFAGYENTRLASK